jgi:hypothetical protein
MLRQAAALLAAVVAVATARAADAPSGATLTVVVRQDKITAVLEHVPVATVLAAIVEQTGAELRGDVLTPRDVTFALHDASLEDALERILGEQSFTLTYDADGRLKRIVLGSAAASAAQLLAAPPGAPHPEMNDAVRRVSEFVRGNPTVPVSGRLAAALGTDTSTFQQVLGAAITHGDARVRADARRTAIRALVADPEVRTAFATTIDNLPDATLIKALRTAGKDDAEQLATALARHGRSPALARRMQRALVQLRAPADGG